MSEDGKPPKTTLRIGTAGWSLPGEWRDRFPGAGTHLERYARVLTATEINVTFRQLPRASTLERWRESVPPTFRFSVKAPRGITHYRRLGVAEDSLEDFLEAAGHLGGRLGPLLFQLPPTLKFHRPTVERFLEALRRRHPGPVALEPRHETWFETAVEELLAAHRVARVAADPPRAATDGAPGGYAGFAYFRLHGSPRIYYSAYRERGIKPWAERIRAAARKASEVWCIFDNTAAGEGTGDALALKEVLGLD